MRFLMKIVLKMMCSKKKKLKMYKLFKIKNNNKKK